MTFRLTTKPTWAALRQRLSSELPARFPATGFDLSGPDDEPRVSWYDGPAEGSVAAVAGDAAGWTIESSMLGPDPSDSPRSASRRLLLVRSFSSRALTLAVVRFRASNVRPFDPERPGSAETLWAILEEDDPATCRYTLIQTIVDLLAGADDPTGEPIPAHGDTTTIAAAWSAKLERLGYDTLWNRAWSTTSF